jgi:hypothetical protein
MSWYGVQLDELIGDSIRIKLENTHPVQFNSLQPPMDSGDSRKEVDLSVSSLLGRSRDIRKLPFGLLGGLDGRHHRFGLVGSEDWSMYPILHPGSLVVIDESRRKVARSGWTDELERPIYFLEHRQGYLCGWCAQMVDRMVVLSHPASSEPPRIFSYPREIEVVGQIVAVATSLDGRRRRPTRTASVLTEFPSR